MEQKIYIFHYDNIKRFFIALAYLFGFILGIFLILINNIATVIFGTLISIVDFSKALDIIFFKELIIDENYLTKKWFLFGERKIVLSKLETSAGKRVWSGLITFTGEGNLIFNRLFMTFETFPIGNDGFRKIRQILIEKNIIKGDEYEWNY